MCNYGLLLRPYHGWIHRHIREKLEKASGNWFSFDPAIDGLSIGCGRGVFIITRASGAMAVVMSETAS